MIEAELRELFDLGWREHLHAARILDENRRIRPPYVHRVCGQVLHSDATLVAARRHVNARS